MKCRHKAVDLEHVKAMSLYGNGYSEKIQNHNTNPDQ
jgi:hypothetical protein